MTSILSIFYNVLVEVSVTYSILVAGGSVTSILSIFYNVLVEVSLDIDLWYDKLRTDVAIELHYLRSVHLL